MCARLSLLWLNQKDFWSLYLFLEVIFITHVLKFLKLFLCLKNSCLGVFMNNVTSASWLTQVVCYWNFFLKQVLDNSLRESATIVLWVNLDLRDFRDFQCKVSRSAVFASNVATLSWVAWLTKCIEIQLLKDTVVSVFENFVFFSLTTPTSQNFVHQNSTKIICSSHLGLL